MRRLILTLVAVASVAGPMAASATSAAAQDSRRENRWDRSDERRDDRWDRRDERRDDRWDRRDERRDDRWDRRDGVRDDRNRRWSNNDRWDRSRHNGYYYNNQWRYGPPPASYYGRSNYRPGYANWRRGAYLPPYYRSNDYYVSDYGRYHLRQPPRGYRWHRVGDDYLLVAIATGLIFDVILNGGY